MSPPLDPAGVVRAYVDAGNRRDGTALERLLAPDLISWDAGEDVRTIGRDSMLRESAIWNDAFPDARTITLTLLTSGDQVTAELRTEGTNTGTWHSAIGSAPPTGRHLRIHTCAVFTIRNGRIVELHTYVDKLAIITQLGAMEKLMTGYVGRGGTTGCLLLIPILVAAPILLTAHT